MADDLKESYGISTLIMVVIAGVYGAIILATGILIAQRYGMFGFTKSNHVAILVELLLVGLGGAIGWAYINSRRAEHQYRRGQDILVNVMESSLGAQAITDENDQVIYLNRNFINLLGGPDQARLSHLRDDLLNDQKMRDRYDQLYEQVKEGKHASDELKVRVGGNAAWWNLDGMPVTGWDGYAHWRIEDITLRHDLEKSLAEERERLTDFMDNAPVGFFSVDEEGVFDYANATFADFVQMEVDELTSGRHALHDFMIKPPTNAKAYDISPDDGLHQTTEIMMKGAKGRLFQAAVTHDIVEIGDDEIRSRSAVRDLSTEQELKQAAEQSEDRFRQFFEDAPIGIALIDMSGTLIECNDAFVEMVAHNGDGIGTDNFMDLIREKDRALILDKINQIDHGDKMTAPVEVHLKIDEDRERIAQLYADKFTRNDEIALHFIDLTEQKSLEAQFTQSQKMQAIGQLAGGVAHDFNNLLTAMIGFCDLLLTRHKPGDPSFGDIMQIKQNANRASNLVRQLLAFSRQQTLQPKIIDIRDVLTELSHLLRRLIGASIELRINHARELGVVKVDQGQLEQVLINLAVNARDAMDDGGRLTFMTRDFSNQRPIQLISETLPTGEWVMVEVSDTGTGIEQGILDRIFEPFFSTKEVGSGTGLGLSTVYGIIRQTGGFIDVDTEMGVGTTFTLYLPKVEPEAAKDKPAKAVEDKTRDLTGSARILIVEDEDAVRNFSARALSNKGYQVFEAVSGESALEKIDQLDQPLDLVVTDVIMPEMDGMALGKRLNETQPDLPIIYMSGYTEDRFKSDDGEEMHFLPKPFTLKQLATKVKEVLDG